MYQRVISHGMAEITEVDPIETKVKIEAEFVLVEDNQDEFIDALNALINRFSI